MDPRTKYLSAHRGARTKPGVMRNASNSYTNNNPEGDLTVASPVGADTSTTAADQAAALRSKEAQQEVPQDVARAAQGGYQRGGFEGVTGSFGNDWYSMPEWQRTKILDASRG